MVLVPRFKTTTVDSRTGKSLTRPSSFCFKTGRCCWCVRIALCIIHLLVWPLLRHCHHRIQYLDRESRAHIMLVRQHCPVPFGSDTAGAQHKLFSLSSIPSILDIVPLLSYGRAGRSIWRTFSSREELSNLYPVALQSVQEPSNAAVSPGR